MRREMLTEPGNTSQSSWVGIGQESCLWRSVFAVSRPHGELTSSPWAHHHRAQPPTHSYRSLTISLSHTHTHTHTHTHPSFTSLHHHVTLPLQSKESIFTTVNDLFLTPCCTGHPCPMQGPLTALGANYIIYHLPKNLIKKYIYKENAFFKPCMMYYIWLII